MTSRTMRWRGLHQPGRDACTLSAAPEGWRLEGEAAFEERGQRASLRYLVTCDPAWRALQGEVAGTIDDHDVAFRMTATQQGWTLNGAPAPEASGCVDLDLGFTPATNLLAIRRLRLEVGHGADARAAWLDVFAGTLSALPQRYERRSQSAYGYDAPTLGYAGTLEIDRDGFVLHYPGLWEAADAR